jgi:hypothetical protein
MAQLHSGFDHFAYFVLSLFVQVVIVESLMMAVASIVPNFLMGIITGAGIQVRTKFQHLSEKSKKLHFLLLNNSFCVQKIIGCLKTHYSLIAPFPGCVVSRVFSCW